MTTTTPATSLQANEEENTLEAKWEALFEEVLENKNMSVKDVETAKFVFFKGAEALLELEKDILPASMSQQHIAASTRAYEAVKEEIKDYLYSEDEDESAVWTTIGKEVKDETDS